MIICRLIDCARWAFSIFFLRRCSSPLTIITKANMFDTRLTVNTLAAIKYNNQFVANLLNVRRARAFLLQLPLPDYQPACTQAYNEFIVLFDSFAIYLFDSLLIESLPGCEAASGPSSSRYPYLHTSKSNELLRWLHWPRHFRWLRTFFCCVFLLLINSCRHTHRCTSSYMRNEQCYFRHTRITGTERKWSDFRFSITVKRLHKYWMSRVWPLVCNVWMTRDKPKTHWAKTADGKRCRPIHVSVCFSFSLSSSLITFIHSNGLLKYHLNRLNRCCGCSTMHCRTCFGITSLNELLPAALANSKWPTIIRVSCAKRFLSLSSPPSSFFFFELWTTLINQIWVAQSIFFGQ